MHAMRHHFLGRATTARTRVPAGDSRPLWSDRGDLRLRRSPTRIAWVGIGANTGGNEVGTNRVPSWLSVSARVSPEWVALQPISDEDRDCGPLGRPPTEPKVSGSNPDGRALEKALQSQISGSIPNSLPPGWEQGANRTSPIRRQQSVSGWSETVVGIERRSPHPRRPAASRRRPEDVVSRQSEQSATWRRLLLP
jgi:hypothetical protein